jgi:hypothetical protein
MNRFILTEDEKRHISNLHNNYISEQNTQDVEVQPGVFNPKVLELQNHLISLGHKIVADGKLGPKTLGATQAAYLSKTTQPTTVQPASTTVPPVAATTAPVAATTAPVAATTAPATAPSVASPIQYGTNVGLDDNDDLINKYK